MSTSITDTQALVAAFGMATGEVQGTVDDTRTEADCARFLETLFASGSATTPWHVVCRNLNTQSPRASSACWQGYAGLVTTPRKRKRSYRKAC
jgi:hypothetical protein